MTAATQDFFAAGTSGDRNSASFAFKTVGDNVVGTIAEEPSIVEQTEFGTGTPKKDKNGNVMTMLCVTLQTELRNWEGATKPPSDENGVPKATTDDTGLRTLWVKFKLRDAIGDAIRKAGAKGLEVGGKLAVRYSANGVFNGFEIKEYAAVYKAPEPGQEFFAATKPADATKASGSKTWDQAPPF